MNYYDVLQVVATASPEEIRASYLRLVQQYHPDRHVGDEDADGEGDRFKQIQEAYEVLHDADRRAEYDRGRPIPSPRPGVRRTQNRRAAQTATQARSTGQRRDVPNKWVHRNLPRRRKGRLFRRTVYVVCVIGLAVAVIPSCGQYFERVGGMSNFRFPAFTAERNEPESSAPIARPSGDAELEVIATTGLELGVLEMGAIEQDVAQESHGEEIERIIVESVDFEVAPAMYADEAAVSGEDTSVSVDARRLKSLEMARQLKTQNKAHEALTPMQPDLLLEAGETLRPPLLPSGDFGPHMSLPVAEPDAGSSLLSSSAANPSDTTVPLRPSMPQDETLLLTPLQHEALEAVKTRKLVGSRVEPKVGGPLGGGLGRTTASPAPISDWKMPLQPIQSGIWKPDARFAPAHAHLIDPDLQAFPAGPLPVSTGLHSQIAPGFQPNLATEILPR